MNITKFLIAGISLPMFAIEHGMDVLEDHLKAVSKYFAIPVDQIKSKSRLYEVNAARQIYIATAKFKYGEHYTLTKIGIPVNRDHTTVIYSCKAVANCGVCRDEKSKAITKAFKILSNE
jgi:chromosomal replication initiation ATPase DnaA